MSIFNTQNKTHYNKVWDVCYEISGYLRKVFRKFFGCCVLCGLFFIPWLFFSPATTEIYTLSLHDALPICSFIYMIRRSCRRSCIVNTYTSTTIISKPDRKSTRLNSSHQIISYAVFCLRKITLIKWISMVN